MNNRIITSETTKSLLKLINDNSEKNFRFGAGYTDLMLEIQKQPEESIVIINLSKLQDKTFNNIECTDDYIRIGALTKLCKISENKNIEKKIPVLHSAVNKIASQQIRNVATLGGNLCTASPAGDGSTALMSLDTYCEILSAKNELRTVSIRDFFTGVRKSVIKKDEVLRSIKININKNAHKLVSDFIKIGERKSMECSIVSIAYHFTINNAGIITNAGVAIGSAAPTIMFTGEACKYVKGKDINTLTEQDHSEFASKVLSYATPITDVRATEWYRKEVIYNMAKSIFEDYNFIEQTYN